MAVAVVTRPYPMSTPTLARRTNNSRVPSVAGLILVDGSGEPLYYNPEAIAVLRYPRQLKKFDKAANLLPQPIQSWLFRQASCNTSPCTVEFLSGRRHYAFRAFTLVHNHSRQPLSTVTALLMERTAPKSIDVSDVAGQFRLTQREQEAVSLLTLGLTSKEIATRMNISPNTVKCFFRLVMTKMAVSTRSGIVGKFARM
jgi:DNA-binding CsgD family transcriptional regulator